MSGDTPAAASLAEAVARGEEDAVSSLVTEAGGCPDDARVKVWALCLGVDLRHCPEVKTDGVDVERDSLSMDLNLLLEEVGMTGVVATAVEETVMMLCKEHRLPYLPEILDILGPLLGFFTSLSPAQVFAIASPFLNRFVPFLQASSKPTSSPGRKRPPGTPDGFAAPPQTPGLEAYTLLVRLLLQYHDCELCLFLDTHKVDAGSVVLTWVSGLFTSVVSRQQVARLWDVLVTSNDLLLPTFLALALLHANRGHILSSTERSRGEGNDAVLEAIHASICSVTVNGSGSPATPTAVQDLFKAARKLRKETPPSAADDLMYLLGHQSAAGAAENTRTPGLLQKYKGAVVLPIDTEELVEAFKKQDPLPGHLKFMVLDCRSAKSFKFARLPTAIHIGPNVGFDPAKMKDVLDRFEGMRGSHFCILGTGRGIVQEDNLLGVIALRFASAKFDHIGIALAGFKEVIDKYIRSDLVEYVREVPAPPTPAERDSPSANAASATGEEHGEDGAVGATLSKTLKDIQGRAAAIDTQALKRQAEVRADKVKKWGRGLLQAWGGSSEKKEEDVAAAGGTPATGSPAATPPAAAGAEAKEEKAKEKKEDRKLFSGFMGAKQVSPTSQEAAKGSEAAGQGGGAMAKLLGGVTGKAKPAADAAGSSPPAGGKKKAFSLVSADEDEEDDFQLVTHPSTSKAQEAAPVETPAPAAPAATPDTAEPTPAATAAPEAPVVPEAEVAAPAAAADADDLFGDPVLTLKKEEKPEKPAAAPKKSAADDLFDDDLSAAKPAASASASAPAAKGGKDKKDIDIFADDFDINDIVLPSDASKKAAKKSTANDDFDDLFS